MPDHDRADNVRPRIVAIAVLHRSVARVERPLSRGFLCVDDRIHRLVVDADALYCASRLLGMLGRDDRDRLPEVADAVDSEHRLVSELEAVALLSRNVPVREHRVHTRHSKRFRSVDRTDARMCVRAAQCATPQHPCGLKVTRVRKLPGHLRDPVDAWNHLADTTEFELSYGSSCSRRRWRWQGSAPARHNRNLLHAFRDDSRGAERRPADRGAPSAAGRFQRSSPWSNGAAQESNLPSAGLPRPTGLEDSALLAQLSRSRPLRHSLRHKSVPVLRPN